ncbi:MAG: hypothetical protein ACQEXJ_07860 [Myxococcota bacterium]
MNLPGAPTYRRMPQVPALLVMAALVLPAATGCDKGLQAELDQRKTDRYQEAADKLAEIETKRLAELREALPDKGAAEEDETGKKHPILTWRATIVDRDDEAALKAIADEYKGTPTETAARSGAAFAKASKEYWEAFREGKYNLARYIKFLDGYLKAAAEEEEEEAGDEFVQRPFLAEAAFDKAFLHAARFFLVAERSPDVRLLTAYPYWQVAFGIPSKGGENFSDYVTRLCRSPQMEEHCEGVPHELRPSAINRPYLKWLKSETKEFLEAHDVEVFEDVARRYLEALDAAMEEAPELAEELALPATYSDSSVPGGMKITMNPEKGVRILDTQVDEDFQGRVPSALDDAIEKKIADLKETPGNKIDYERVVLEAPGTLEGSELVGAIQSAPRDKVRQVVLVGRRRADDSLRRTGVLVRLPAPDEGDTTSYAFKDQRLRTRCAYIGVAGKPPVGRKSPGSYLVIDEEKVRAAKLSRDEETRELSVSDFTLETSPDEREEIWEWADDNEGIVRMFVSQDFAYDEIMKLVSGLLYRCKDIEVTVDEREDQKVKVTCGESEERDITLVLGLCD